MILSIVTTGRCNFSCRCCAIPASRLELNDLAETDFGSIKEFVAAAKPQLVLFSGGEPTLILKQIQLLQADLPTSIRYGISTNGLFLEELDHNLGLVRIDLLSLSYDKFHSRFSTKSPSELVLLLKEAQDRGVAISVNTVVEGLEDFSEVSEFVDAGINISTYGRVYFPNLYPDSHERANSIASPMQDEWCPNSGIQGDEIVFFYPGYGFTRCASRLIYERLVHRINPFAKSLAELQVHPLWSRTRIERAENLIKKTGIQREELSPSSPCDFCTLMNSDNLCLDQLSLAECLDRIGQVPFFAATRELDPESARILRRHYWIRYGFVGSLDSFPSGAAQPPPADSRLKEVDFSDIDPDWYMENNDFLYNELRAAGYSEQEILGWKVASRRALAGDFGAVSGKAYILGGKLVGATTGTADAWGLTPKDNPGWYIGEFAPRRHEFLTSEESHYIWNRSLYWQRQWAEKLSGQIATGPLERDTLLMEQLRNWGLSLTAVAFSRRKND